MMPPSCGLCWQAHSPAESCEGYAKRTEQVRRVQELRRSNAATPVPSGRTYRRREKHRKNWLRGWLA